MKRTVITIDEEKCSGCGLCANACHEGAIAMIKGKAKLIREDYCDGLGACLPACPTGAIRLEEREAAEYNQAAAQNTGAGKQQEPAPCACPGSREKTLRRAGEKCAECGVPAPSESHLSQWPVQLRLAPANASYPEGAELLIAADCAAYACGDFHSRFMKNRITLIGCPKLDPVDYPEKLTAIFANNAISGVTVVRMEVPCCGGLVYAVKKALQNSGKRIPYEEIILSTDGKVL